MNSYFGLNWLSYLLTGVLALVASSLLSGCVFGNNEVDQTTPWDGVTGNYDTQPTLIQFCATFTGQAQTCADGATDQVELSLTDPVGLKLLDSSGDTAFYDPLSTSGSSIELVVNTGSLAISLTGGNVLNTYQAWSSDASCDETDTTTLTGQLTRYTGAPHTSQGLTITGRVSMDYNSAATFPSGCSSALTAMTNCYENLADCGGGASQEQNSLNQQTLDGLFTPLINPAVDLGLVSLTTGSGAPANSIANLVSVSVEVTYQ